MSPLRSALALATLLAVAAAAAADAPWFCHGLDCPVYTVKAANETAGFELRAYSASKWVGINITGINYEVAVNEGFNALFDYISGQNAPHTNVPMTAPVTCVVTPGQGPNCNSTFLVSFFVPFAFWNDTPTPSDPNVFVYELPARTVGVVQFSGFTNSFQTFVPYIEQLGATLEAMGLAFQDVEITANYDPPFRVFNRHNEVWITVDDSALLL